jgi:UDPglucose--hexose-1-phosphate uridylyltransferase
MSELRENIATKEWVVIATERARRPDQFRGQRRSRPPQPERLASCPFCPGNEAETGGALATWGDARQWSVRAVRNKFPALTADARCEAPSSRLCRHHRFPFPFPASGAPGCGEGGRGVLRLPGTLP